MKNFKNGFNLIITDENFDTKIMNDELKNVTQIIDIPIQNFFGMIDNIGLLKEIIDNDTVKVLYIINPSELDKLVEDYKSKIIGFKIKCPILVFIKGSILASTMYYMYSSVLSSSHVFSTTHILEVDTSFPDEYWIYDCIVKNKPGKNIEYDASRFPGYPISKYFEINNFYLKYIKADETDYSLSKIAFVKAISKKDAEEIVISNFEKKGIDIKVIELPKKITENMYIRRE